MKDDEKMQYVNKIISRGFILSGIFLLSGVMVSMLINGHVKEDLVLKFMLYFAGLVSLSITYESMKTI
jgi:hypothetical protein